jgi:signal peptidase I
MAAQKKAANKSSRHRKGFTAYLKEGWEWARTLIYAVVLTIVFRAFAYEPFAIPSGSMIPTLLIGDYLFVSKFSYGYSKFSLPFSPNIMSERVFGSVTDIERGDVAVFRLPTDTTRDFIKRVVGLPGDKIQMIDGILHINDQPVIREYVDEVDYWDSSGRYSKVTEYIETLPNGVKHRIWERSDQEFKDNTAPYHVPEGHFFMMGDNRDFSEDSRFLLSVGYVPFENFIGRADFLFYSYQNKKPVWQVWTWPRAIRWERIFDGIE